MTPKTCRRRHLTSPKDDKQRESNTGAAQQCGAANGHKIPGVWSQMPLLS